MGEHRDRAESAVRDQQLRARTGALAAAARAGAVISVDRQADLACHCLYVYKGGAGRGMKGLALRRRTPRRRLPSAARRDR